MMVQTPQPRAIDDVAARFMAHRPRLYAIAHRTLGSPWQADDAVQETWLRLQRADVGAIESLEAWLTTVVSRVCIDLIRQQVRRREDSEGVIDQARPAVSAPVSADPSDAAMRVDDLAVAMQVVLDTL